MTTTGDSITGVVHLRLLTNSILLGKSFVANADRTISTNCTLAMVTAVNTNTVILELVAAITTGDENQCDQGQGSSKHATPQGT
jgi:hypothetical protein